MEKEEKKRLRKEFDEFTKNNPRGILLLRYLYYSIIASLIVFLLPKDILTQYPIFRYFTDFMKNIFPNIEIFAQRSKMPELTEFYFSYMWSIVILMVMLIALIIPKVKAEAKIFFRKDKFPNRFLPIVPSLYNISTILSYIAMVILFGFMLYLSYTGSLIDYGISRLRFSEIINTRFGMFFISNISQTLSVYIILTVVIDMFINTIFIKELKKGE